MGKRKASPPKDVPETKVERTPIPTLPYFVDGWSLESLGGVEVEAGIDEAGRGPVLGPMVYGIALSKHTHTKELKELGVDDSKALNEEKRSSIFNAMNSEDPEAPGSFLSYSLRVLPPGFISRNMLGRTKVSLNEMSFDAAFALVERCMDFGVLITKLFVDTVGPPEVYQKRLEKRFPGIDIKVSKKADSLFPVVSAASIVAKVTRDRVMQSWEDVGVDELPRGSGYPADPVTKEYIRGMCDPIFGLPSMARHSWSTAQDAMDKYSVKVKWEDDEETGAKGQLGAFFPSKGPSRHNFFRDRHLASLTHWP